jgi:uncharacterized protein YecT (DUF1311 family)
MTDLIEKLLFVFLGALLSGGAFLLKRLIEGRPTLEVIERHEKLLSLRERLKSSGTSLEDLGTLEAALLGKAEAAEKIAFEYEHRLTEEIKSRPDHDLTQMELNLRAGEAAKFADNRLKHFINDLEKQLDAESVSTLHESQKIWELYRDKHVQFCGERYRGGSIRPMIQSLTYESLTVNRLDALETSCAI